MCGQPKRLTRNYLRQNCVYFESDSWQRCSLQSQPSLSSAWLSFVLCSFGCSLFGRLFREVAAQWIADYLHFKLSLLGKELMPSESIKDLGVTFDPTLSFNKHISVTVSSCMSKLAQISRAKHAFNSHLLVLIINVNYLLLFSLVTSQLLSQLIKSLTCIRQKDRLWSVNKIQWKSNASAHYLADNI